MTDVQLTDAEQAAVYPDHDLRSIGIEEITVREGFNPRTDKDAQELQQLEKSIREHGVLQPLLVREFGAGFALVDGERRLTAAGNAGVLRVPAIVTHDEEGEGAREDLVKAFVTNEVRVGLNPIEQALAFQTLKAQGFNAREIARKCSTTEKRVKERLALLDLPEDCRPLIASGEFPLGAVKVLQDAAKVSPGLALAITIGAAEAGRTAQQITEAPLKALSGPEGSSDESLGFLLLPNGMHLPDDFLSAEQQQLQQDYRATRHAIDGWNSAGAGFSVHDLVDEAEKIGLAFVQRTDRGFGEPYVSAAVIGDRQWLSDAITRQLKAAVRKAEAEHKKAIEQGTVAKPTHEVTDSGEVVERTEEEVKAARKAEREAVRAGYDAAFARNTRLGAEVLTKTKAKPIDRELALHLVKLAMRDSSDGFGGGPAFCQERYAIEPEKASEVRKFKVPEATGEVWAFIAAAETAEEVVQRFMMVLAQNAFADHGAVAPGNRPEVSQVARNHGRDLARWFCAEALPAKERLKKPPADWIKVEPPKADPEPEGEGDAS